MGAIEKLTDWIISKSAAEHLCAMAFEARDALAAKDAELATLTEGNALLRMRAEKAVSSNLSHDVLLKQLREIEWAGSSSGFSVCPACKYDKDEGGHARNCWLAAAITRADGEAGEGGGSGDSDAEAD